MRQKSNSPELSLDQLDEVVGGTAVAPMGLGGSLAPPAQPHHTAAFGIMTQAHDAFAVPASVAAAPIEPLSAPMGLGGNHNVQTAPATHGDPVEHEEAVFAADFVNAHAPMGLGGNR